MMESRKFSKKGSVRSSTPDSPAFWRRFLLDRAKLKATSRTSALLSGFAMVAMVELQLNSTPTEGEKLSYVIFAVITTLLIATHMFSLLISTCILPSLEVATAGANGIPKELRSSLSPTSTPYESMKIFIEVAWVCSTGFGILLFFVEVGVLSWVKFFNSVNAAAYASIGLVIPLFFIFTIFAFKFYQQMVGDKLEEDDVLIAQLLHLRAKIEASEKEDEEECRKGLILGDREDSLSLPVNNNNDNGAVGCDARHIVIDIADAADPIVDVPRDGWKGWNERKISFQSEGSKPKADTDVEKDVC